jgi:integrase
MPCHHKLETYLDAYLAAASIEGDRKGRYSARRSAERAALRSADVARGCLVHDSAPRRRCQAGTSIGCHTFRATGITDYLTNGGKLKIAQRMAGHSKRQNHRPVRPAQRRYQR